MSLATILKTVGKDLSHVGTWIEDGLKIAVPVIGSVDPPIGAILTEVETILGNLLKSASNSGQTITLTPQVIQSVVTAVATLTGIKVGAAQMPQVFQSAPSTSVGSV
jgi:hypothetical protein